MQFCDEVALRVGDPGGGVLVAVHQRGARCVRLLRIEYRWQYLVLDDDQRARRLGDLHGLGDDGGDPLPAEAHHAVEHLGVVGIVEPMHMASGREADRGAVTVSEHREHPGQRLCGFGIDGHDAGMGVWAAQHRNMGQPRNIDIQRVALGSGDDPGSRRRRQRAAHRGPFGIAVDVHGACQGVGDSAVARTPAQVALEVLVQIAALLIGEGRCGDDHSRGAEAALESGGVDELLLQWVQVLERAQPGDRDDRAAIGTVGGVHA